MANRVCPWRRAYSFDNFLRRFFYNPRKIVGPFVGEGATVTDIGCGMGFFSIAMARMVGESGLVIAVDIQEEMLEILSKRAKKAGVAGRIKPHLSVPGQIGVDRPVSFALASWVAHEIDDRMAFMKQVFDILEPAGKLLVAEPKFHVKPDEFEDTVGKAVGAGFERLPEKTPRVAWSRAMLFEKPGNQVGL